MSDPAASGGGRNDAGPASEVRARFKRLRTLLRQMFQLDRGDLDFGLYRIMKMKSAEVSAFLDDELLPQIRSALRPAGEPGGAAASEGEVYRHLAEFFSRYYDEGDFFSRRRRADGQRPTYLLPYDGEEIKLHWANADQHYIKTADNYSSYAFSVGGEAGRRVRFDLVAAENDRDNIKPANGNGLRFLLSRRGDGVAVNDGALTVSFEHRSLTAAEKKKWPGNGIHQQARLNEDAVTRILGAVPEDWATPLAAPAPTDANGGRTVLAQHLDRYTSKNSFDYFIHDDLGDFLRQQLDLYLNTEVLRPDDFEQGGTTSLERALTQLRAVRQIGHKIIAFLAQLEDFQKRLWLKKKFVLESHWCVSLDRVPEALRAEVASNARQREEWVRLFSIDEIRPDLGNGGVRFSEPLTGEFLHAHPFLVLDTRHFDRDFTDRLLESLSDAGPLEEQQDGLLVHGENYQALNLLQARYGGQVDCVYIDPPYNTGYSEILYKNTFKHSSWLSLMQGRLRLSRELATATGSHIVAIDENEQERLGLLLSEVFPDHEKICASVVHNKKGIQGSFFSYVHDSLFFCIPPALGATNPLPIPEAERRFENLRKWGRESERRTARNCFYPIEVKDGRIASFGEVCPEDFHPGRANVENGDSILVYPVDAKGDERKWRYARDSVERIRHLLRVKTVDRTGEIQIEKCRSERQVKTVWDDSRYIAGDYGTRWLTHLGLKVEENLYPKSLHAVADAVALVCGEGATVLDYFAGSGTTGHAVMELNREDGGRRRFVLVEVGDHFDAVLLPRLKKVAYSRGWKDGQPAARDGRRQVFRYVRLESYEDTMDSLESAREDGRAPALPGKDAAFREDYRLRYFLGEETAGSACLAGREFRDPFRYTLSVVRGGIRREVAVDLPATFDLLLGLRVEWRRRIAGVLAVAGADREGRRTLILWRNVDEIPRPALDAWFETNRGAVPDATEVIYANGDHCLNALRRTDEAWVAHPLEARFRTLMFGDETR